MDKLLEGVRVAEFCSTAAGPFCAMLLADMGAEVVKVEPTGRLVVNYAGASDLLVDAAVAGVGVVYFFEDWLRPHFSSGALTPILERW